MDQTTEFLILADGRILVHNVTPTMAAILSDLNPADELMGERAQATVSEHHAAEEQSSKQQPSL